MATTTPTSIPNNTSPTGAIDGMSNIASGVGKTALGLGAGTIQLLEAYKNKKDANAAMPSYVDPNQAALLAEIEAKRKSIDTGSDYAAGMNQVDQNQATADNAIVQSTGGDVGGTIEALLKSQKVAGQAGNNVFANGANNQKYYFGMYGDMLNKISDRSTQLQLEKRSQDLAEWNDNKQYGQANLMSGAAEGFNTMQDIGQFTQDNTINKAKSNSAKITELASLAGGKPPAPEEPEKKPNGPQPQPGKPTADTGSGGGMDMASIGKLAMLMV